MEKQADVIAKLASTLLPGSNQLSTGQVWNLKTELERSPPQISPHSNVTTWNESEMFQKTLP